MFWICAEFTITHIVDVPMVAFEEFCRAKTCILFVRKARPNAGHKVFISFPKTIGQDKHGDPLYQLNSDGRREGSLDNEMSDATDALVAAEYTGSAQSVNTKATRFCFQIAQKEMHKRGILVPRFWWRQEAKENLNSFIVQVKSNVLTLGQFADEGIISTFEGHGSPPGNARATGNIPYVKVTDLKNWRINENPTNFIHKKVADQIRKNGVVLKYADLVTPSRASSNIGQFSLVLPWQTNIVLTREVLIIRVESVNKYHLDPFLLLALMSLKAVQEQYRNLVLMQTNREHLGDHWREVMIPFPTAKGERDKIGNAVRSYFEGVVRARHSLSDLDAFIEPSLFGIRP